MKEYGVRPDAGIYAIAIEAALKSTWLDRVDALLLDMRREGIPVTMQIQNLLRKNCGDAHLRALGVVVGQQACRGGHGRRKIWKIFRVFSEMRGKILYYDPKKFRKPHRNQPNCRENDVKI